MTIENKQGQELKLTELTDRRRCMMIKCPKLARYEITRKIKKGLVKRELLCRDCLDRKRQMTFVPDLK